MHPGESHNRSEMFLSKEAPLLHLLYCTVSNKQKATQSARCVVRTSPERSVVMFEEQDLERLLSHDVVRAVKDER